MRLFESSKIFLSFGPFTITWYAVFILTGVLVAYELSQRTMKKWGYSTAVLEDYVIPMMFCGILGARIYYVIFEWSYYSNHLDEIVKVWHGGLAIHGGLIAGILFSIYYFKKKRIHFLRMMDVIFPNVMIAQAFGRWGNFMNQEAYGGVVPESYFNYFPSFIKNQMFIDGAYHHPTFLYESCLNVIGFLFITFFFRKKLYRKQGDCGFMYFVWYGVIRFFIEAMRTDSLMLGPLKMAQFVSLVFIVFGVLGLLGVYHKVFHLYEKPVILFDLDGTLQDSQKMIYESFKQTFIELKDGYVLSDEELNSFFGPTLEESFGRYFEGDDIEKAIKRYQAINQEMHYTMLKPCPHATEMLKACKDMGIRMGIVSNKRIEVVKLGIQIDGFEPYFDVVLGKEDLPKPKPDASGLIEACKRMDVSRDNVIYVGDAPGDIKAAKNMAAYSIGYSEDLKRVENLKKENPNLIINDLMELVDLCQKDMTWNDKTIW